MSGEEKLGQPDYYPAESHNTLLTFTILAVFAGIIAILIGLIQVTNSFSRYDIDVGGAFGGIGLVLVSVLVIIGAYHTLRVTQGFQYWNHGITSADRAIGMTVVVIGFLTTFWIAIFILVAIAAARGQRK